MTFDDGSAVARTALWRDLRLLVHGHLPFQEFGVGLIDELAVNVGAILKKVT
jgi:hypothetical protein